MYKAAFLPPKGARELGSGAIFSCGDTEAEMLNAELYSRMDLFFTSSHASCAADHPAAAGLAASAASLRPVEEGGPSTHAAAEHTSGDHEQGLMQRRSAQVGPSQGGEL